VVSNTLAKQYIGRPVARPVVRKYLTPGTAESMKKE